MIVRPVSVAPRPAPTRFRRLLAGLASVAPVLWAAVVSAAPSPSTGTITPTSTPIAFTGGLLAGGNSDESTCQENITCENFILTVAAGDYTAKRIDLAINWLTPAADYDMYVHEGSPSGPVVAYSADGTTTGELAHLSYDPGVLTASRTYYVHVVAFAVAGDQYQGQISVAPAPPPRIASYPLAAMTFSPNVTLTAPYTTGDGEPSCRVDVRGNAYVGGIRGVPAGVDLWRFDLNPTSPTFDPAMQNPIYLGQPDAFVEQDPNDQQAGGADGGGDIDICTSFPSSPTAIPVVTTTSLAAAEISSSVSFDRGETFTLSPAVVAVPADDREWQEADGDSTIYMMYRAPIPATGLFCARSDDHGLTYPITSVVSASGTTPGYIDVDHTTHEVYIAHTSSSGLFVSRSVDRGLTWSTSTVDNSTAHGSLFDVVKVGDDGTVYCVWSDEVNVFLAHSTDHGVTWSGKVRVNDSTVYKINLFPWLEAGSAGRVDIVWYASTSTANTDASDWVVRFAQTTNATDPNPAFAQATISDHVIHGSNISTGGLTGSLNRNLLDYFQVALDPQGAAVIAFTDDHNDYDGNVYVTRQLDGPSLYATANGNGYVNAVAPPSPIIPDPAAPEVSDYLHDALAGLLQPIDTDNPFDILWVDYSCTYDSATTAIKIRSTMKVSTLSPVPSGGTWRMSFTANAPGGNSDRGDQFYVLATTTPPATPVAPAFTWGTAVRAGSGSMTYTQRGTTTGVLDSVSGTIRIDVPVTSLNNFVTHGPPIGPGSILQGLRGRTASSGANAVADLTRGGTSYRVTCGLPTGIGEGTGVRGITQLRPASPNPARGATTVSFTLGRAEHAELSVFDITGRRVRSIEARTLPAGNHVRTWDGRNDHFQNAAPGIYLIVLQTAEGRQSQRVAVTR